MAAAEGYTNLAEISSQNNSKTDKSDKVSLSTPVEEKKGTETGLVAPVNGPLFFYEDEIFRVTKSGNIEFGMVMENWEMYSSSEDSDEDIDSSDKVPKGHVAVSWHPDGTDGVIGEDKVHLSDRSLMPGDVVRRLISGKDTQRGYARSVKVRATVQTVGGSRQIIQNIPATSLKPVQKVRADTGVYLDSWVGTVRDVKYKITLRFPDNSVCMIDDRVLADHFTDVYGTFSNSGFPYYYPGQKFRGAFRHLSKADWIKSSDDLKRAKDRKMVTGTVTRVELKGILVTWQWKTPSPHDSPKVKTLTMPEIVIGSCGTGIETSASDPDKPKELVKPDSDLYERDPKAPPCGLVDGDDLKRLKFLNLFESCTVQLGDISFFSPGPDHTILKKDTWKRELRSKISKKTVDPTKLFDPELDETDESDPENDDIQNSENLKPVVRTSSTAVSTTASTKKCFPKVATRALRKKKLRRARHPTVITCGNETQLVVEALHTSSIVDVVWQDGTVEEGMRSIDLYPIHHLDDHEFFPGDFVTKADSSDFDVYGVIQTMDHTGRVALVKWFKYYVTGVGEQAPKEHETEEVSVYDIKDHADFRFRPGTIVFRIGNLIPNQCPAGQVMDNYPDGKVRVWWGNGISSACWPQDLFTVRDNDSDDGEDDEDWNESKDKFEEDSSNSSGSGSNSDWETDEEEVLYKIASETSQKESASGTETDEKSSPKKQLLADESASNTSLGLDSESNTTFDLSEIALSEPVEHFTILESVPETHKFFTTLFEPLAAKRFTKTVQKELKMLRDNLPGGIYVKAYESRMDLYSVMIHGPENTPYQDCLFFFDLQLPFNYPDAPPSLHYISFTSNRLNPNLYEGGKVCVSLLGTWSGRGTEVWTSESTILQLLISIQGLILVPEPYYNEAGYEKQKGSQQGLENSRMYNEMVLIKLVQSMSKMLSHPPAPWQNETVKHIREKGPRLVARYRKWLSHSETPVESSPSNSDDGTVTGDMNAEGTEPPFPLFPVSRGFSITLKKMLDNFNTLCMSASNLQGSVATCETPTTTSTSSA